MTETRNAASALHGDELRTVAHLVGHSVFTECAECGEHPFSTSQLATPPLLEAVVQNLFCDLNSK